MINAPLIFKINEYVRSVPDEDWDFDTMCDCPSCWLGHCGIFTGNKNKTEFNELRILRIVYKHIFGITEPETQHLYKKSRKFVTKDQVCDLVERYTIYKIRQEHKWKQYEYRHFGQAVTDKRGICI